MDLLYKPYIDPVDIIPIHQGKVRESLPSTGFGTRIQVATDRISTHNKVHKSLIPNKGEVLTLLTVFWLTKILSSLPDHLVAWGRSIYEYLPAGIEKKYPYLHYRALVVLELDMVPYEFVFRRFLTGSLLKNYRAGKDPYGISLPPGLTEMSRFSDWMFTPTEKSETDDPVISSMVKAVYPLEVSVVYQACQLVERYLLSLGITLIDTKVEMGGNVLADELFTPDSSRFAWTSEIREGVSPPWLDKQLVRDYVEKKCGKGQERSLFLPEHLVSSVGSLYQQVLYDITKLTLLEWRQLCDQNT